MTRSRPMVVASPVAVPAEQKLPKPCVGSTAVSSGSSAASRCAESYWARASSPVSRGSTRSGRPTVPISSEPPVKTATASPSSSRTYEVWCGVWPGVASARSTSPSSTSALSPSATATRSYATRAPAGTR